MGLTHSTIVDMTAETGRPEKDASLDQPMDYSQAHMMNHWRKPTAEEMVERIAMHNSRGYDVVRHRDT